MSALLNVEQRTFSDKQPSCLPLPDLVDYHTAGILVAGCHENPGHGHDFCGCTYHVALRPQQWPVPSAAPSASVPSAPGSPVVRFLPDSTWSCGHQAAERAQSTPARATATVSVTAPGTLPQSQTRNSWQCKYRHQARALRGELGPRARQTSAVG